MSGISSLYQHGPFTISELALMLHRKRNALSMALAGSRSLSNQEWAFLEKIVSVWQNISPGPSVSALPFAVPAGATEDESLRLKAVYRTWIQKRQAYETLCLKQQCLRSLITTDSSLSEVFRTGIQVLLDTLPDPDGARTEARQAHTRLMQLRLSIALRRVYDHSLTEHPTSPGEEMGDWEKSIYLT